MTNIKNLILNTINSGKKAYELAMQSETKRVYQTLDKLLETFPELHGKGYMVMTLGEYFERKNSPSWRIEDLKKNNEYNKKGCFKLSCIQTGINPFDDMPVLTTPEILYVF